MVLFISLGVIFAAALIAPMLYRRARRFNSLLLAGAPILSFCLIAGALPSIAAGDNPQASVEWFSALGVAFDLRLDGFTALMALLVIGIGALIVIYAGGYLHGHAELGRFQLYLLSFMGSMLGLVLSDNLILMLFFWELTSITSYLLIGFKNEEKESRVKALQALLVTGLGGMAMLAGFILIGNATGTYRISELGGMSAVLGESPYLTAIIILVLLGAFTKSAQVPFHFWLPNAMVAPTPVSAYLHSATMVKAGVFLMARLTPALGEFALWSSTLMIFGGATLLLAVLLGLLQTDLKGILAYSTLAVLGLLTMLLGVGTEYAFQAMVVFLLGHALYKAAFFLAAGSVDHETGTRDVTLLRGLRRTMPITATAAALAAFSQAGFPPFFGFLGKEYVYKTGFALEGFPQIVLAVAFVGNIILVALALKAGIAPFWGKAAEGLPKKPHEAPASMWIGPLLLGTLGLLFGMFPNLLSGILIGPSVSAIQGRWVELTLELWHGINGPLILSLVTLAGGIVVFFGRRTIWKYAPRIRSAIRTCGAEAAYDYLFEWMIRFANYQTRRLQSGFLHNYVFIIALATVGLLSWGFFAFDGWPAIPAEMPMPDLLFSGVIVVLTLSTIATVITTNRITALVNLGVVGFGIALLYVYFGAPDLAITQVLVETLTVVLLLFAIYRLPALRLLSSNRTRARDVVLSVVFGGMITGLVLAATAIQVDFPISEKLASMSYSEAHGRDIVNVILVDFRALDTLGEITVISVAALGIAAMIARRVTRGKEVDP